MSTPDADALVGAARTMCEWQHDEFPVPLHPGDLGWHWRAGAAATATSVRTWRREGQLVAVGLLDGPVMRLSLDPGSVRDDELARAIARELSDPAGALPGSDACVEARFGGALVDRLRADGWTRDGAWTPLRMDLGQPVGARGLRVEVTGPTEAPIRVALHRAAFERSTFTVEQWRSMAGGPMYDGARCLVGYDEQGAAVAATTVWSAEAGRPGLIEPLGVHRDHRGCGHGRAITLAAAAALRELGASSATVCTPSVNTGGVAAYAAAGFTELPQVRDLRRPG